MEELGFEKGLDSACVFRHNEGNIAMSVHGDDFLSEGP
jgi:hypothetical protein